jgi:hypothetical protein
MMLNNHSARQTRLRSDNHVIANLAIVCDVHHVVELDAIANEGDA